MSRKQTTWCFLKIREKPEGENVHVLRDMQKRKGFTYGIGISVRLMEKNELMRKFLVSKYKTYRKEK